MYVRDPSELRTYDVCIVGAGPVGLTLALECEAAHLNVLLIEADRARAEAGLDDAAITDPSLHGQLTVVTSSGLGGTSNVWGGRCVPFDDVDFEQRPYVPQSNWPIDHHDVKPWYAQAAHYLDCGREKPIPAPDGWDDHPAASFRQVERLSSQPRLAQRFKERLQTSRSISVYLNQVVTRIELDPDGNSVRMLRLRGHSLFGKAVARFFVLACGGIQSTRLLLDLQRLWPRRFAGDSGPLGRFYMGHLTGRIASIVLNRPEDIKELDYIRDAEGHWVRRRFSLSRAAQREHSLLNTVFWLGSPAFWDASHGSAAASGIYFGLRFSPLAKRFVSQGSLAYHDGRGAPLDGHLANVLADPLGAIGGIARAVKSRFGTNDLRPLLVRNPRGTYALHYHAEQIPNPLSRIRLRDESPGLVIDFRYSEEDARSVVRAHEVLDDALRQTGRGYLKYWQPPEERLASVLQQSTDGYHQIGTTRMSESEHDGVVDGNSKVHGLNNLYVAGSSVFNTSSQANPTFLAVAMAARLAAHLRSRSSEQPSVSITSPGLSRDAGATETA